MTKLDSLVSELNWKEHANNLAEVLTPEYTKLLELAWDDSEEKLPSGILGAFTLKNPRVQDTIKELAGRVTGISDTTKDDLQGLLQRALSGDKIPGTDVIARQIREYGLTSSVSRAKTIARTETTTAYNHGALLSYDEAGVTKVEILDSDNDPECATRNGQVVTVEEAQAIDPHPNCVIAFLPIVDSIEKPAGGVQNIAADVEENNINEEFNAQAAESTSAQIDRYAAERGMSREEYIAAVDAHAQKLVDGATPSIRIPHDLVDKMLDSGRFKSQFETGRSGGYFDPEFRSQTEEFLFKLPSDAPANAHPIYGFLQSDMQMNTAGQYGEVVVEVNPSAANHATLMGDDSLNSKRQQAGISPYAAPDHRLFNYEHDPLGMKDADHLEGTPYIEVQFHNGVGVSDIDKIWFESYNPPSAATQARLDELGVKWGIKD